MNNVVAIVEKIESLNVMELVELCDVLKKKFNVTDSMLCGGGQVAAAPAAGPVKAATEKTAFDVKLIAAGEAKVAVIKVVRELTGLGLKEAKDLVETPNCVIKSGVPKTEAEAIVSKLKEAGATCELH